MSSVRCSRSPWRDVRRPRSHPVKGPPSSSSSSRPTRGLDQASLVHMSRLPRRSGPQSALESLRQQGLIEEAISLSDSRRTQHLASPDEMTARGPSWPGVECRPITAGGFAFLRRMSSSSLPDARPPRWSPGRVAIRLRCRGLAAPWRAGGHRWAGGPSRPHGRARGRPVRPVRGGALCRGPGGPVRLEARPTKLARRLPVDPRPRPQRGRRLHAGGKSPRTNERTLALNVLAPLALLLAGKAPCLRARTGGQHCLRRSSGPSPQPRRTCSRRTASAASASMGETFPKLDLILLSRELALRFAGTNSVHPGLFDPVRWNNWGGTAI